MSNLKVVYSNPNIQWKRVHNVITSPLDREKGEYISFHDHSLAGLSIVDEQHWYVNRRGE